jgi:hypothetical protein
MASYAEVVKVLGELYRADEEAVRGPLRGRVQNLQKLHIPLGLQVGKGRKIDYQREQIYQLMFCMELAEMGLTPSQIALIVRGFWENVFASEFRNEVAAQSQNNDRILVLFLNQMSATWDPTLRDTPPSLKNHPLAVELPLTRVIRTNANRLEQDLAGSWRRLSLINISELVREVEPRLADILPPPQKVPNGLHKKARSP